MPPTPKEKKTLRHEQQKSLISNIFRLDLTTTAVNEGGSAFIVAVIEVLILAVLFLLSLPEPVISKLTAIILAIVSGIFACAAIIYILVKSWGNFKENVSKRDRDEDAEDKRYRENLNNLPG